jgi:hypothetical protein
VKWRFCRGNASCIWNLYLFRPHKVGTIFLPDSIQKPRGPARDDFVINLEYKFNHILQKQLGFGLERHSIEANIRTNSIVRFVAECPMADDLNSNGIGKPSMSSSVNCWRWSNSAVCFRHMHDLLYAGISVVAPNSPQYIRIEAFQRTFFLWLQQVPSEDESGPSVCRSSRSRPQLVRATLGPQSSSLALPSDSPLERVGITRAA